MIETIKFYLKQWWCEFVGHKGVEFDQIDGRYVNYRCKHCGREWDD